MPKLIEVNHHSIFANNGNLMAIFPLDGIRTFDVDLQSVDDNSKRTVGKSNWANIHLHTTCLLRAINSSGTWMFMGPSARWTE